MEAHVGDVYLMHAGGSLDVIRKPMSQETYRGREAVNDGFSWITGHHTFPPLTVTGMGSHYGRDARGIFRGWPTCACGLGTDKFRKILRDLLQALHLTTVLFFHTQ